MAPSSQPAVLVIAPVSAWRLFLRKALICFQPALPFRARSVLDFSFEYAEIDVWHGEILTVRELVGDKLLAMKHFVEQHTKSAAQFRAKINAIQQEVSNP